MTLMPQLWTSYEICKAVLVKVTVLLNSITSSFMSFRLRHQKKIKINRVISNYNATLKESTRSSKVELCFSVWRVHPQSAAVPHLPLVCCPSRASGRRG